MKSSRQTDLNSSPKRIVVTGGAGFIGSNLVRMLLNAGHYVLNVDKLTYAGNLESLSDVQSHPKYSFSHADIADGDKIRGILLGFEPTAIFHLAAESHVDRSIEGPEEFVRTNVLGTFAVLRSAYEYWRSLVARQASAFRLIHVSTDEVYGSLGEEGYFKENTRYDPRSPYSASKASSDHLVRAWHHTYGLPTIVTNCSNNYGPYQFPEKLIPLVILRCLRNETLPVYGTGENVRDWLHVEDHCYGLSAVLERGLVGETYNIGGNNEKRNIDLVRTICNILDQLQPRPNTRSYEELITFVDDRPGHDLRYAIDATKMRTQIGWEPTYQDDAGFVSTVEWYLSHENWWKSIVNGSYQLTRLGRARNS